MRWITDARAWLGLGAALGVLALAGCGDDDPQRPGGTLEGVVPDFSLTDVNPNSPTSGTEVSPRDYVGQVSAWYFGHST